MEGQKFGGGTGALKIIDVQMGPLQQGSAPKNVGREGRVQGSNINGGVESWRWDYSLEEGVSGTVDKLSCCYDEGNCLIQLSSVLRSGRCEVL
jgi:hypothetical protein